MEEPIKNVAINKIVKMPKEQVAKVLIFMAGMEAEHTIKGNREIEKPMLQKNT